MYTKSGGVWFSDASGVCIGRDDRGNYNSTSSLSNILLYDE